jgi:hypothetical protein
MSDFIHIDASRIEQLERLFGAMPAELRHRVAARALKRVATMGDTAIARDIRNLVQINYGAVRKRVKTYYNAGDLSIDTKVRSDFIPLIELPDRMRSVVGKSRGQMERRLKRQGQTLKGSYRAAFLATVNGHRGVWRREGAARGPLDEQFGPNPAHAVGNAPDRYQLLLSDVLRSYLLPRVLHEIQQALPK